MKSDKPALKRSLGLPLLTLYGLGNILGAGIYVLVGKVAGEAGVNTMLAFLMAMIIAGLTAFSYMELSRRFPQSASVSVYLHKAFGLRWLSTGIGVLLVLGGVASAAALAQGFAGYLNSIVPVPLLLAALGLIVGLGLLASRGMAESAMFAAVITLVEVAGLLLIIVAGIPLLESHDFTSGFVLDPVVGLSGVLTGAFLAFYAFIGFEDMVNVVEEVKQPRRTMPRAILLSLITATILYILVVLISLAASSPDRLSQSGAPLNLVLTDINAQSALTIPPVIISYIGLMATVNGVLVQIVMGSRILYGLSKQGWLPARLGSVDAKRQTPRLATVIVVAAMCLGVMLLSLVSLAGITSMLVLTVFILVNLSLVVLKLKQPEQNTAALSVPIFVPATAAVCCLGLVLFQALS